MSHKQYSEADIIPVTDMLNKNMSTDEICAEMGWKPWTLNRFYHVYFKDFVPAGNCRPYADGRYFVFDDGRVWSRRIMRFLKGEIDRDGYLVYGSMRLLGLESKAHRLVLKVFDREPRPGEQTRHRDGTPSNNYKSNLAWGTGSENQQDRIKHGRHHWVKYNVHLHKNVRT